MPDKDGSAWVAETSNLVSLSMMLDAATTPLYSPWVNEAVPQRRSLLAVGVLQVVAGTVTRTLCPVPRWADAGQVGGE